jgi:hypothetical protein
MYAKTGGCSDTPGGYPGFIKLWRDVHRTSYIYKATLSDPTSLQNCLPDIAIYILTSLKGYLT